MCVSDLESRRYLFPVDCSNGPHEASKGEACNASLIAGRYRTASTPSILKRDKKRKRALVCDANMWVWFWGLPESGHLSDKI